jgi:hypothetical protein
MERTIRKNDNLYLAWTCYEAAHFAIQLLSTAKRAYGRRAPQRNPIFAKPDEGALG